MAELLVHATKPYLWADQSCSLRLASMVSKVSIHIGYGSVQNLHLKLHLISAVRLLNLN